MENHTYKTLSSSRICARNGMSPKFKRELQLFLNSGTHAFVAAKILGSLDRTVYKNHYVMGLTDRYSRLMRATSAGKTSSTLAAYVYFYSWVVLYGIHFCVLTDNVVQFKSKLFTTLGTILDVEHLTPTTYGLQKSGKVKLYNCTIVMRLQHSVAKSQKQLDYCVHLLPYA